MRHFLAILIICCVAEIAVAQDSGTPKNLPPPPEAIWNLTPEEVLTRMEAALKPVKTISVDVTLRGKEFGKFEFKGQYVGDLTSDKFSMMLTGFRPIRPKETIEIRTTGNGTMNWQETNSKDGRSVYMMSQNTIASIGGYGWNPMLCFKTVREEMEFTRKGNGRYADEDVHVLIGTYRPEFVERLTKEFERVRKNDPKAGAELLRQLQAIKTVWIFVSNTDFLPRGYETMGNDGVLESFHFSNVKINSEIPPETFNYIVPDGTTVVNMDELFAD